MQVIYSIVFLYFTSRSFSSHVTQIQRLKLDWAKSGQNMDMIWTKTVLFWIKVLPEQEKGCGSSLWTLCTLYDTERLFFTKNDRGMILQQHKEGLCVKMVTVYTLMHYVS